MTTAAFVNNAAAGFWSVAKGWELNGYLIVVAAALAITGPGALSLDTALELSPARRPGPGAAGRTGGCPGRGRVRRRLGPLGDTVAR
jgi:hypothetical protein